MDKMKNLAVETRKLAAESKKLWDKCLSMMMPQMADLDDETALLMRDSLKLMNSAWEYIDLCADAYEEQGKQYEETRNMLEEILKEVKYIKKNS